MPSRDSCKHRGVFRALAIAATVAFTVFSSLPAQALPIREPAANRSVLLVLQNLRGWLVSLWGSEGMTVDPSGGQPGGSPAGNTTTTGEEGGSFDPQG